MMNKDFILQSDLAAAELCGVRIIQQENHCGFYIEVDEENGGYEIDWMDEHDKFIGRPFYLNNLNDLMLTVKALGEKEISIRASDSGHSCAYYDERNHSWDVGYKEYVECVRHAVIHLKEKSNE